MYHALFFRPQPLILVSEIINWIDQTRPWNTYPVRFSIGRITNINLLTETETSKILFFEKLIIDIMGSFSLFPLVHDEMDNWKISKFLFLSVPWIAWGPELHLKSCLDGWWQQLVLRTHQFTRAMEGELYSLRNFTGTVGFISTCATAESPSVNEA